MNFPSLLIVFLAGLVPVLAAKSKPRHLSHYNDVRYSCAAGRTIQARYVLDDPGKVLLQLSDGRKFELTAADAASGARYANKDESRVFWSKGDEAFLAEGDTITYAECTAR